MQNQSNPNARDVVSISIRSKATGIETRIPVFGMTREQAIQAYELMQTSEEVIHAYASVIGGNKI